VKARRVINWKLGDDERALVDRIAARAAGIGRDLGLTDDDLETQFQMDVTCVHNHICRLRLGEMADADDFNFGHDVLGIRRHLDRERIELRDFFVPRFAAPEGGAR